jgi:hypothetical protein
MNRVSGPTMVGNEFFVNTNRNVIRRQPEPIRRKLVLPQIPQIQPEPEIPYQNLDTFALNSTIAQTVPVVARPRLGDFGSSIFTRTRIKTFIIVLVLAGATAGIIANKQHVIALADGAKSFAVSSLKGLNHPKVVTPAANPRQLIIHSADTDAAVSALISQSITLNIGGVSQSVSSAVIANWFNTNTQGSKTTIKVNTAQVGSYLSQAIGSSAHNLSELPAYTSALNQIANNLLKAQGVTVTIPASAT